MTFEEALELAQATQEQGSDREELLTRLRASGVTIIDSLKVIREIERVDLGKAKEIIDSSETWADRREGNKNIRRMLLQAALEESDMITHGEETYYSIAAAEHVVRRLPGEGAALTGIEGFRITDATTEPLMDYIAHWPELPSDPWEDHVERCADYGLQVLTEWKRLASPGFKVALTIDRGQQRS